MIAAVDVFGLHCNNDNHGNVVSEGVGKEDLSLSLSSMFSFPHLIINEVLACTVECLSGTMGKESEANIKKAILERIGTMPHRGRAHMV